MGGHGGLNILPQKRWNVYNRDNRLKVSQDEAKAAALEAEERARAEQAEREFRYARLQKRALGQPEPAALEPAATAALQIEGTQQADTQLAVAQPLEHVNFWKEDELKMKAQHPEVEAEKKNEPRKRGNPDMYTSDPRFDERFQLGYQMKGEQPWWAKTAPRGSSAPDPQALQAIMPPQLPAASPAAPPAQLPAPSTLLLQQQGSEGRGREGRSRRQGEDGRQARVETGDSEQVAAAKQLLRQVLGDQVDALIASSSSSDDSDGSDSDSSGSSGSGSSSSDSDGDRGGKRSRSKRKERQGKSSRARRSKSRKKRRRDESSSGSEGDGSDRERSKKRHKGSSRPKVSSKVSKDKSKRKHKSKERHKERSGKKSRKAVVVAAGPAGMKSIEQLRAERMEREIAERKRERLVLVGALGGPATCEAADYNSGFGHAAALKKSRSNKSGH